MDSFATSKLAWSLLEPPHVLIALLFFGVLMQLAVHEGLQRMGRFCIGFSTGLLVCFVLFPIGDWLIRPLENRFEEPGQLQAVQGIIVLGGGENVGVSADRAVPTIRFAASRLIQFVKLARQYPQAELYYSGGINQRFDHVPPMSQAQVAQSLFHAMGFDDRRVVYESQSRTTYENAVELGRLVSADKKMHPWLLVTSAYHMPRAVAVFRAQGWRIIPYPTDYLATRTMHTLLSPAFMTNMGLAHVAVHEYLGLLAYKINGKTDSLWPRLN